MRHEPTDPTFFVRSRERLCGMLRPGSIVIVVSNDILPTNADGTLPFQQNADLYYLCGVAQEETALLLFPDAVEPREREILFVKETSEQIAIWDGEKLGKEQATAATGIQRVEWSDSFDATLHRLIPQADQIYLITNEQLRSAEVVETRNDRLIREIQRRYPLHSYQRLAPLMQGLRMIKDAVEIERIQKACDITGEGFRRVLEFIRPGVGEWEIEAELIHEFMRRGSRGFAYSPIIGSGKNTCVLHYLENNRRCQDGELVLMDVAAEYAGWKSDLTRTVPVNGRFGPRQRQVYEAVLRVLRGANEILRPPISLKDYQQQVVAMMEIELVNLGLIDAEAAAAQGPDKPLVKKYFMHGTSHHLGLDVHDVAAAHQPVAVGMVFTIEPGIYIREEGFGIRLENDVLIGPESNRDLMAHIPIEVDEIEALMNAR